MANASKSNSKTRPKSNIGILDASKVSFFSRTPNGKNISPYQFNNAKVTRKIIGYALSTVRRHGVQLNSWDSIEIDIDAIPADSTSLKMDVHFMTGSKVTHGLLGLVTDLATEQIKGFDVIAIQPREI